MELPNTKIMLCNMSLILRHSKKFYLESVRNHIITLSIGAWGICAHYSLNTKALKGVSFPANLTDSSLPRTGISHALYHDSTNPSRITTSRLCNWKVETQAQLYKSA